MSKKTNKINTSGLIPLPPGAMAPGLGQAATMLVASATPDFSQQVASIGTAPAIPKQALSVPEFAQAVGIGITRLYQEIRLGRIHVLKCGRRTLIPVSEAPAFLARLAESAVQ